MENFDLPSENNMPQENGEEGPKKIEHKTLQKARVVILKVISYFSGDMQAFGKWMKSKSNNICAYFAALTRGQGFFSFLQRNNLVVILTHVKETFSSVIL